jgi:hypothetical protein
VGDIGLYFPLECQLSQSFLSSNNLYKKSELNSDKDKKGYFDENGRIRCQKFRGHKSEGLFIGLESLNYTGKVNVKIGDIFDELNGIEICKKYYVKRNNPGLKSSSKNKKLTKKYESKLIENQFRLHIDTAMLYRNLHKFNPTDIIHISKKLHGTSLVSSKIICKKKLNLVEKILKKIGVNVVDTHYDYIHSSRKVIKNTELNKEAVHYYSEDIWGLANDKIKEFLQDGMTMYCEIVGYTPQGGYIQKDYDYGCDNNKFDVYVYRITYTTPSGKVFEFSGQQVQDYCKQFGLKPVPEVFFGYAENLVPFNGDLESWRELFLLKIKELWNEHNCSICVNEVPEEGVVVRKEGLVIDSYKCKSNAFYDRETQLLDKGEVDIESDDSDGESNETE